MIDSDGLLHTDTPMGLGDHLDELRKCLVWVVIAFTIAFFVGFIFHAELKELMVQPLLTAISMCSDEMLEQVNINRPTDGRSNVLFPLGLQEATMSSMRVSMYAAFAFIVPFITFQLWKFVSPALRGEERHLGFLFIPTAVLFFYSGVVLGYMFGIPTLFYWLISWAGNDPTINLQQGFAQSQYFSFFFTMTIAFGLLLDIPWLILVLIRVGLVTAKQIAAKRRIIIAIAIVLAAILTPPDIFTQLIMFALIMSLFESGLLAARILYGNKNFKRTSAPISREDGEV